MICTAQSYKPRGQADFTAPRLPAYTAVIRCVRQKRRLHHVMPINMSPKLIIFIAVIAVFLLFLISKFFSKPQSPKPRISRAQPKEKQFQCARCGAISSHTERTIEAWRNKKTKFFCQTCHSKWLASQQFSSRGSNGTPSGCLGAVVLFAVVPFATYFLVRTYA